MLRVSLLLLICFFATPIAMAANSAQQNLTPSLPQILSIEKIIVETAEYDRDEPLANMNIKSSTPTDPNTIVLELSPVKVQINTNMGTPIAVYAQFKELKHQANQYNFSSSQLKVSPTSYTINNPYDHVISGTFIPYVNVLPDTVMGAYRGSLVFTLGAL